MTSIAEKIRGKAVVVHDTTAHDFDREYRSMESDPYFSAFTVGRKRIDAVLQQQLHQLPTGSMVLDAGCGTGDQVKWIRSFGMQVVGLEPAPEMRNIAQKRNPESAIVDGSILELPFDDNSFDFVLAIEVLRYLEYHDVQKAYAEMLRVVKPGGKVFVTLVNRYSLDGFFLFDSLRKAVFTILQKETVAHCEFFSPNEVKKDLKKQGVRNIAFYGRLFAPIRPLYALNIDLAKKIVRRFERSLDSFAEQPNHLPFAGHLIAIFEKPIVE